VPFRTAVTAHPVAGLQLSVVHVFPSLQTSAVPAAHVPLWQVSAPLHTFPSAHAVPLATGVVVQPVAGLQPSVVHTFPSLQTSGVPAVHTPAWQLSEPLQVLPSGHAVPLGTTELLQTPDEQVSAVHGFASLQSAFTLHEVQPEMGVCAQPLTVLQLSAVHALPSLQLRAVPAVQVPPWQVSAPLQMFVSAHDVPFRTAVAVQPKTGLHPSVVHTFPSLQLSGVPAVQAPLWQLSAPLHTLPSRQGVPFRTAVFVQPVAGLQASVVHTFESLQLGGVPAAHPPFWQVSAPLHALPSLQAVPFETFACWQPKVALHVSVVQGFASSQLRAVPAAQVPA
jgi:hypothetical protein